MINNGDYATWEAPCRGRNFAGVIYLDISRILPLKEVVADSAPFAIEMEKPIGVHIHAYLYGQGVNPQTPASLAVILDQIRWFLNPGGEGDPGICTYTSPYFGYRLDYSCNWEPQEEEFFTANNDGDNYSILILYSPGRGAPYGPPMAKLEVKVKPQSYLPSPDLDELEKKLIEEGVVSTKARRVRIGGIPALRQSGMTELGYPYLTIWLIADERVYVFVAYWDIQATEEVIETFRVGDDPG